MKILSNAMFISMFFVSIANVDVQGAAQEFPQNPSWQENTYYIVPFTWRDGALQVLLQYKSTIVRGEDSSSGPRYWAPFQFGEAGYLPGKDFSNLTAELKGELAKKISDSFAESGINNPKLYSSIEKVLNKATNPSIKYIFVETQFSTDIGGTALWNQIKRHNKKLQDEAAAKAALPHDPNNRRKEFFPSVEGTTDIRWIKIQDIFNSAKGIKFGQDDQACRPNCHHEIDPKFKDAMIEFRKFLDEKASTMKK